MRGDTSASAYDVTFRLQAREETLLRILGEFSTSVKVSVSASFEYFVELLGVFPFLPPEGVLAPFTGAGLRFALGVFLPQMFPNKSDVPGLNPLSFALVLTGPCLLLFNLCVTLFKVLDLDSLSVLASGMFI